jgi:hypothetical protein
LDQKFRRPKIFSEILDHTFSLSKNRFTDFFLILLILMGPVYLLEAIFQLFSGVSFFREVGTGSAWYDQILSSFDESKQVNPSSLGFDVGSIVTGIISAILYPVAKAAILYAIHHISKNEEYTVGSVLKKAFSRFWPILGSSILFGLIIFGVIVVPIIIVSLIGAIGFASDMPIAGIIVAIVLLLGFAVGIGCLITRWSFYFGSVVIDKDAPGFIRSWKLTQKRTWILIGMYVILYLIISSIDFAVQMSFSIFLGNSVLLKIIVNIVTMITTMFFTVGYAVIYLDLKFRHDADDLKDMLEDYSLSEDKPI